MAWCTAASLEDLSSLTVVKAVVSAVNYKVKKALDSIPKQLLVQHRNKIVKECTEDTRAVENSVNPSSMHTDGRGDAPQGSRSCHSCPDSATTCCLERAKQEIQVSVLAVKGFWMKLPKSGLLRCLNAAVDRLTEVHPKDDSDFVQHLSKLCLKLVLLTEVFIDRDYGDRDKLCVVPSVWVNWMVELIKSLEPLPTKVLSCYGAMYPGIVESVLKAAPNIRELNLSHLNITDDLLVAASKFCPRLERLRLLHCYPWLVLSRQGFARAFFGDQSYENLVKCLKIKPKQRVEIQFANLKQIELSYGPVRIISDFHIALLALYKNLNLIYSEWKFNFFDEGYENFCEDVIIEAMSVSGTLSIDNLFIKADYLHELSADGLDRLVWHCPLLTTLRIDCRTTQARSSAAAVKKIGCQLAHIARGRKTIHSIHANVSKDDWHTRSILIPFILTRASSLIDITLEACSDSEQLSTSLVKLVLETCPQVERLRLKVWNRSLIRLPTATSDTLAFPQRSTLSEIWLHEGGPGEIEGSLSSCRLWLVLLNSLLSSAPNIKTLSFTICEGLINILVKLHSNVERMHVHFLDGHEWQPSENQLHALISNQPKLQCLFLEEISGDLFWKVQQYYEQTQLQIHWGTLNNWPRS
ncbi:uncharacterized protein LOC108674232 [Hyalella azteca]|uniref:Uncharacterized protein LOC108674232 n=1 Tax=Hyalella azteca TaxID=294128 RepID=A0A8B7NV82_HYAAZ|nr:uncharacterized protein LOC108674232 [Hyalella azteca]